MKKLIQEKQWAELRAYCLEKLLAGIENAEEIVDTFIEELAKESVGGRSREIYDKLCGMYDYDYDEEDVFFKIKGMKFGPIEDMPEIKGGPEGIFHKGCASTTWRFLEDGNPKDTVKAGIAGYKKDGKFELTHVSLTDNPPDEDSGLLNYTGVDLPAAEESQQSSADRYSEEQFERRYKAAGGRYLNPESNFGIPVYQDGCFVMTKDQVKEAVKNGASLNYEEQGDGTYLVRTSFDIPFEEQHSKRLDEEVNEIIGHTPDIGELKRYGDKSSIDKHEDGRFDKRQMRRFKREIEANFGKYFLSKEGVTLNVYDYGDSYKVWLKIKDHQLTFTRIMSKQDVDNNMELSANTAATQLLVLAKDKLS